MSTDEVPWDELDRCPDRMVYQTRPWLEFIAETQNARPVILEVQQNNAAIGWFTGLVFRKLGVPIMGSPFPGWTTMYLGFTLLEQVPRSELISPLIEYVFEEMNCWHLEMMDRAVTEDDLEGLDVDVYRQETFEVDLTLPEDELYQNLSSKSCRYSIRKSKREGVTIEIAEDDQFARDYYDQLEDVFAKQDLVPTYPIERVTTLIDKLLPTGNLLLLRARGPDGTCIATGIFPGYNRLMQFWGGASWREYQNLCPNEPIVWYAMRYWKERGIEVFDMGGGSEYKRKYGGRRIYVPWIRVSRFGALEKGRNLARKMHSKAQKLKGRLRKLKGD